MHTKVLCIVHQRHSRVRRVGRILKEMGYVLDIRKPCIGDSLPENMENYELSSLSSTGTAYIDRQ